MNEWRAEARRQLYSALQEELRDVDANIEELLGGSGRRFARFVRACDRGKEPALKPVYFSVPFEPHLFKAATEGTGIKLLDVSLMYDLGEFYNSLD